MVVTSSAVSLWPSSSVFVFKSVLLLEAESVKALWLMILLESLWSVLLKALGFLSVWRFDSMTGKWSVSFAIVMSVLRPAFDSLNSVSLFSAFLLN